MKISIVSDMSQIPMTKWETFIDNHPNGSVFQSPDIANFYLSVDNYEPVVITAFSEDKIIGVLLAVIQKEKLGYITSRTVVYGGPLISTEIDNEVIVLDTLLKSLIQKVKYKSIYIQFRNFVDVSIYKDIFHQNGFAFTEWLNYKIDASSEQKLKENLSKSKIRQIKKGFKERVKIIAPENINQLKEFYLILKNLYKHRVKKPLPSWSFFENFYKASLNDKLGVYRLVKFNEKIIGGIMIPVSKNRAAYEWYVCGLDKEYKQQYPSVMATWAGIEYSIGSKLKTFDFMGAGSPHKSYGVREFKSKFGGEEINYGRFERINNKPVYGLMKLSLRMLSPLLNILR